MNTTTNYAVDTKTNKLSACFGDISHMYDIPEKAFESMNDFPGFYSYKYLGITRQADLLDTFVGGSPGIYNVKRCLEDFKTKRFGVTYIIPRTVDLHKSYREWIKEVRRLIPEVNIDVIDGKEEFKKYASIFDSSFRKRSTRRIKVKYFESTGNYINLLKPTNEAERLRMCFYSVDDSSTLYGINNKFLTYLVHTLIWVIRNITYIKYDGKVNMSALDEMLSEDNISTFIDAVEQDIRSFVDREDLVGGYLYPYSVIYDTIHDGNVFRYESGGQDIRIVRYTGHETLRDVITWMHSRSQTDNDSEMVISTNCHCDEAIRITLDRFGMDPEHTNWNKLANNVKLQLLKEKDRFFNNMMKYVDDMMPVIKEKIKNYIMYNKYNIIRYAFDKSLLKPLNIRAQIIFKISFSSRMTPMYRYMPIMLLRCAFRKDMHDVVTIWLEIARIWKTNVFNIAGLVNKMLMASESYWFPSVNTTNLYSSYAHDYLNRVTSGGYPVADDLYEYVKSKYFLFYDNGSIYRTYYGAGDCIWISKNIDTTIFKDTTFQKYIKLLYNFKELITTKIYDAGYKKPYMIYNVDDVRILYEKALRASAESISICGYHSSNASTFFELYYYPTLMFTYAFMLRGNNDFKRMVSHSIKAIAFYYFTDIDRLKEYIIMIKFIGMLEQLRTAHPYFLKGVIPVSNEVVSKYNLPGDRPYKLVECKEDVSHYHIIVPTRYEDIMHYSDPHYDVRVPICMRVPKEDFIEVDIAGDSCHHFIQDLSYSLTIYR